MTLANALTPRAFSFLDKVVIPQQIETALQHGAALVLSVSGGKDSDAMCYTLLALHRRHQWPGDVYLIHADLGRAEWPQTLPYVRTQARRFDLPLAIVRHSKGDLIDGIRRRMEKRPDAPPFPSSAARWCTSDYKRAPISRWIRRTFPHDQTVICAMGLRAAESLARAKRPAYRLRKDASAPTKNRLVYDWSPLHAFTEADVWGTIGYTLDELGEIQSSCRKLRAQGGNVFEHIKQLGFKAHPAYALGNKRLSCALCVLADKHDLANGAKHNPELLRQLVQIERESGFTFRHGFSLDELSTSVQHTLQDSHPIQLRFDFQ